MLCSRLVQILFLRNALSRNVSCHCNKCHNRFFQQAALYGSIHGEASNQCMLFQALALSSAQEACLRISLVLGAGTNPLAIFLALCHSHQSTRQAHAMSVLIAEAERENRESPARYKKRSGKAHRVRS